MKNLIAWFDRRDRNIGHVRDFGVKGAEIGPRSIASHASEYLPGFLPSCKSDDDCGGGETGFPARIGQSELLDDERQHRRVGEMEQRRGGREHEKCSVPD